MATRSNIFIMALCLIGLVNLAAGFQVKIIQHHINDPSIIQQSLKLQDDCKTASIYEYINNFSLPLQDVSKLLGNQFSRNQIESFDSQQKKVKAFNISSVSKLVSNDQSESYAGPFKAIVFNNQIEFTVSYELNITEGLLKKTHTFGAVTKVSNISISYEKQFKMDTGVFVINTATVKFDVNSMTSKFNPAPNKTEEDSFNNAIKGTEQSLYTTLVKFFSSDIVKQSMQTNSKNEHLSKIYDSNPYNYNFYSTNISVDVSTLSFTTKDSSLTSGMTGKFPQGNSFCSHFVPDFTNTGASMFFSKEFAQNFVQYNIAAYPGWKNLRVDKKTVRQNLFQWELLDLDFIVDGLWNDLGQFSQNQIYFTCNVQDQVATQFNAEKTRMHLTLSWACQGFVRLNTTTDQKVLDFVPRINHMTDLKISSGGLNLYVNQLQLIDCQFNEVASLDGKGKYTVSQGGAKLARVYIEQVFNDFRTYPIGNWFKVNANAQTIKVEDGGNGVWVI